MTTLRERRHTQGAEGGLKVCAGLGVAARARVVP